MLIGYSLSFCIQDILADKVKLEDVSKIVSSTCAKDVYDFIEVVYSYCSIYWNKDPKRAMEIAAELWNSSRIDQPRLRGEAAQSFKDIAEIWREE